MPDENKLLKVTNINGSEQLYYDGLQIVKSLNMIEIDGDLYVVRDDNIVLATGKVSVLSLVKQGKKIYYRN